MSILLSHGANLSCIQNDALGHRPSAFSMAAQLKCMNAVQAIIESDR